MDLKGYQIDTSLPLEDNVKGILSAAVAQLNFPVAVRHDPHEAIHDTRRTIKRIRALLKMIREGTGYSFYLRENRFFRDISRTISRARDDYVLLETLQFIETKTGKQTLPSTEDLTHPIRDALNREMEALSLPGGAFETLPVALEGALRRIDSTLHLDHTFTSLKKGLRRSYRKGRRLWDRVEPQPNMQNIHEFRKMCRVLQFQSELLAPLYPELMNGYATSVDAITEKLGHIRDLQRLQLYLLESGHRDTGEASADPFMRSIRIQSRSAVAEVNVLAPLIFAEKPGEYTARIQRYWQVRTRLNKPLQI